MDHNDLSTSAEQPARARPSNVFSVRTIMFGALAFVTIIPLIVFWIWPFSRAIDEDLNYSARAHLLIAHNLGIALDGYYKDVSTAFELLSANLEAGREPLAIEPMLTSMHFRHLCLVEAVSGRVLASYIRDGVACPEVVPERQLAMFRDLASAGAISFSAVSEGPTGEPLIYVVHLADDLLTVGALRTDYFADLADQISFGENGHAAIVDATGRVLAHPNSEWVLQRRDLSALSVVARMTAGETGVATFYSPAFEADMIAGYTQAPLSGWSVMVPQPVEEIEREIGSIRSSALGVLGLGIAISVAVAWVISGLLASPIRQLLAVTRSVDSAQPSTRLPPLAWYAPTEMRALASSLDEMLARIGDAAEKVIQAQHRAEHDNIAKTEFLANMSHELRTPLNAIVGFSDALLRGDFGEMPAEKQKEYIHHIHASALHLSELIQDVTDVSFIEAGAAEHRDVAFPLQAAIEDAVNLVRVQAANKGLRVSVKSPGTAATLRGDPRQFAQVLINLLTNAIKFTPGPEGNVSVSTRTSADGDLQIEIADNGIGIPRDQIAAVMQPFKRGGAAYVRDQPGSGLGLSIVTKILAKHGGGLSIDSEVGVGTTATIHWPRDRVSHGEPRPPLASTPGGASANPKKRTAESDDPAA